MIMAAPFPSGLSQNVQIFLPLTDLDYRMYNCDLRAKHTRMTHVCMHAYTHSTKTRVHISMSEGYINILLLYCISYM